MNWLLPFICANVSMAVLNCIGIVSGAPYPGTKALIGIWASLILGAYAIYFAVKYT